MATRGRRNATAVHKEATSRATSERPFPLHNRPRKRVVRA